MAGVLAQVGRHQVRDMRGPYAHRLRRSVRGQSWAEKSLKNGQILVEFQKLRKPQDAKGTYFPRNSPPALLEWGSAAPTDDGKPNHLGTNAPVKPCRSFGGIDLRAHAEIVSVRRSDTPTDARNAPGPAKAGFAYLCPKRRGPT